MRLLSFCSNSTETPLGIWPAFVGPFTCTKKGRPFINCRVDLETKTAARALAERDRVTETSLVKELLEGRYPRPPLRTRRQRTPQPRPQTLCLLESGIVHRQPRVRSALSARSKRETRLEDLDRIGLLTLDDYGMDLYKAGIPLREGACRRVARGRDPRLIKRSALCRRKWKRKWKAPGRGPRQGIPNRLGIGVERTLVTDARGGEGRPRRG